MKKTVIRLLSVCIVLLLTGSILVGCSGKTESSSGGASTEPVNNASAEPSNTSDSKASDAPVTIQYWFQGTDEATVSEVNTIIEMFNEKYPNIKVEATGMSPTISDQETKLNAAVLSDTYPDVIQLVLAEVGSRGALNDFEPLEPYIEKWENKDDVFESAYEMGKYAGVQVAIGCAPNPQVFVYPKDLFEKAGLDPNTPPKTWAELANAAEKLTERDAQGNVTIAGLDIPYLLQNRNGQSCKKNSPVLQL